MTLNEPREFEGENHLFDITGFMRTLTEAPSYTPKNFSQQVVLVTAGGSTAAYFYNTSDTTWYYTTLT